MKANPSALQDSYGTVLHRILNDYAPVDENTATIVLDAGTIERYKKNEVIFHEQRFNVFEDFQFDGVAHRYNLDEDDRE